MAKKPNQTSRKSRFELLEDRRLLTAWNVEAKFNANTATNAGSGNPHPTNDGGEAAFGDGATQTAAMLGHSTNNNYGDAVSATYHWTPGATDAATSASPWTFGDLSSGPAAFNATTPYTYSGYVNPNSFDNYLTGSAGGSVGDGVSQSVPGLAGYSRGENAVFYNYGNNGLNGDGAGEAVINPFDSYATIPTGNLLLSSLGAAPSAQFTAPSTGSYTLTSTFTDPYFDPFNGTGGANGGNDSWAWDTGQGQFLIYKIASGTPTLLASGFPEDIAAVTTVPTVGNTVTSGSGLTIHSGTVLGSTLNSETPYSANYPTSGYANTGLPLVSLGAGGSMGNPNATQQTNTYAYGSNGTWALTNVGTFNTSPPTDTTHDEYDMSWSVTTTVSLSAGDKIQLDNNPEWMQGSASGDYFVPIYMAATVTPSSPHNPPTVTTSGSTGQTFTLGGSAAAVDSGIVVSSTDTDITGATMQITNFQTGDSLNFTNQAGITGIYSAGLLTLSGSATPAQYTTALQSVTFSTTSTVKGTRSISVVGDDSTASPTTGNTGTDTVVVAIAPPVVTANQATKNETAGQTVTVDSAVTVSSFDTDVTGATMTISAGTLQAGDTLHFTTQNGITGVYSGGVMTLSGSATPAQYQTALQSITYSTTSTSTVTRNISMVVSDSNDTGNVNSNTATTQIVVSAPVAISALYVNGTAWSAMDTWMASNSLGSATLGYALLTGANQVKPLPWSAINKIDVQFNGALSATPSASSFKITGGTGGAGHAAAAPSVTSVTSLGGNAYALTLSGSLGYNNFIISIASSSTVFGPAVTDVNGAGIAGSWTNSSSTFPSGGPSGLAGTQFNFQIDVLPGDTNQNGTVNSQDSAKVTLLLNDKTTGATSASYSPFVDVNGNGTINSQDGAVAAANVNFKTSNITNPSNPSGGLAGGSGFTALALGVQESGSSSSSSSTPAVSNVSSPSVAPATTTSVTTSSSGGAGSGSTTTSTSSSHNHGRHSFAATDAAVSDFDLADLWA